MATVALGVTLVLAGLPLFSLLEMKGLDLLFVLRGTLPTPGNVVVVAIDEPSFAELGRQWPWPRSVHAQLIQQLHKAGARVIGFDILFAEPASDPAEDQALARALRGAGNIVLASDLAVVDDPFFRYTIRVDPIPTFKEAAEAGVTTIYLDADGVVRRTRLLSPDMPSFALQTLKRYLTGRSLEPASALKWSQSDLVKEVLINHLGPPRTVPTVSYYQALDYEYLLPPGIFAGKIVLVGRSLEALPEPQHLAGDTFLTPFFASDGGSTSGVEIQATIIDNFLTGRFVSELNGPVQFALLWSLLSAASLLLVKLRPLVALFATSVLAGLYLAIAYAAFTRAGVWLPIFSALLGLGLVYGGYLLVQALTAERERRRMLEEINRDLETKIAERTQALSAAHQELRERHRQLEDAYQELARTQEQLIQSEKMASLGLLVAGVAHELNNPISFVHSNLEFIEEYTERLAGIIQAYGAPDKAESRRRGDAQKSKVNFDTILTTLKELLAGCKEGAERIKKIVLDLRTFSRTDDIGPFPADLHEGIESTLNLLAKEYQNRIIVHRDYGNLPRVECFPGQLNQVFMNLLQNAAQAIPGQGEVWIKTRLDGDRVVIAIRDNGMGIPEQNLAKIFDPFFTTKPVGAGTGLGLSISYGIIEKHGGSIRVASTVNQGAEFIVELPVQLARRAA